MVVDLFDAFYQFDRATLVPTPLSPYENKRCCPIFTGEQF